MEQIHIAGRNDAPIDESLEIEDTVPKFGAEQDDGHALLHLAGLDKGERLEQLIHGAKAAGEHDQRLGHIDKPVLADKKVVEFELQIAGDKGIEPLLKRQADAEADRCAADLLCASIGGLHDAGAAAGANDEAAFAALERHRPAGQCGGKLLAMGVVRSGFDQGGGGLQFNLIGGRGIGRCAAGLSGFEAGERFLGGADTRGAKHDDRVLNILLAEALLGLG